MREVTQVEKQRFWEEVREEFPDDPMMQEIHYVRLMHHAQVMDMSSDERVRFFEAAPVRAAAQGALSAGSADGILPSAANRGPTSAAGAMPRPRESARRDTAGVITNAAQLTVDEVAHQRVLCPG